MPIALSERSLVGVAPGTVLRDISNGGGSGSFGWLTWAGDNGVPALVAALTPPGTSPSYRDPDDPADRRLDAGDRVRGRPGVANAKQVRDALDRLKQLDVTVPTWDAAAGGGSNLTYRIADFALVRLLDYALAGENRISARFLGRRDCSPPASDRITVETDEDTPVTATISASDEDSASLTFTRTQPAHGTASEPTAPQCSTAGARTTCTALVTYTPASNRNGSDSFTYQASDGVLTSRSVPVEITIRAVNDRPVAGPDLAVAVDEDGAAEIALQATDPDGDPLTFAVVDGPEHGELGPPSSASDARRTYRPDPDFAGTDRFTYRASDGAASSNTATVTITVTPASRPPIAVDDAPSGLDAREDAPVTILSASLLANDSDPDGDPLTIAEASATAGTHGTVDLGAAGITYTPEPDYNGPVAFDYRAGDGSLQSSVATVRLTVAAVNDAPRPVGDTESTAAQVLTIPAAGLAANDSAGPGNEAGQTLTVDAVAPLPATRGDVRLLLGQVVYTPPPGFTGHDEFAYTVCDDGTTAGDPDPLCAQGIVSVAVTAAPRPPVAENLSVDGEEDTPTALLLPATDPDGDPLTFSIVDGPAKGTLSPAGDGSAGRTYTPDPDANGADSFTFRASDGALNSNTATIAIALREVNDVPIASADSKSVTGRALSFPAADLTANDSAGPGEGAQALTVTRVSSSAATHGVVTLLLGTVTYTAGAGFNGDATFGYEVCDDGTSRGAPDPRCAEGEVTVTVTQAPAGPIAEDLSVTTDEDADLDLELSATSPAGGPLSYAILRSPEKGALSPSGPGPAERSYTPNPNANGNDSFAYLASDGTATSNAATVTITIRPVNDPPLAADDVKSAERDAPLAFPAGDVLDNDEPGPDNEAAQTLRVTSVTGGADTHGTVALASGEITYTPAASYIGDASFQYRACDDGETAGVADPECDDGTVDVKVAVPAPLQITVTPATRAIADGETVQYTATGRFRDGSSRDITDEVDWASSAPAVANVTPDGEARGGEPGETTITASEGDVEAHASLTVTGAELRSIVVEPVEHTLLTGDSQDYTATGVLSDGRGQNLDGLVTWTSESPSVATIAADGRATASAAGTAVIRATTSGVSGTATLHVHARVGIDADPPTAASTAPRDGAEITEPTDVVGTATDPNFLRYTVQITPAGEASYTTVHESTTPVVDGVLAQLDPTMLRNGLYEVLLTVYDAGGNASTTTITVDVARDMKVGNFSIPFQDLDVPLSGIPITVNRVYDSRDKGVGDFGVGWRLDIKTLQIKTNRVHGTGWQVNRSPGLLPTYTLVPLGDHKVTLAWPDGRVEVFDLTPTPASSFVVPLRFTSAEYRARAGTQGTLRALDAPGLLVLGGQPGPVTLVDDTDLSDFDPQLFEYTAPGGTVYVISKTAGVQSVRDTNGNTLTVSRDGIIHSSGVDVEFARDAQGRITTITDPAGNEQRYAYDARGDLVSHTDGAGSRTTFAYNRSHGLIEISDPRGHHAARNEYDDDGRLVAIVDAAGRRTTYEHDVEGRQEIIRDRRGNATVYEYDDDGNVLRETDPLGHTTTRSYDGRGNVLRKTDPLGNTTIVAYDDRNNVVRREDPNGDVVTRTFNALNQVLTERDRNGNTTTRSFDARGNLLSETDPSGAVTSFASDAAGNLASITEPTGSAFRFGYDSGGRMTTYTDASGVPMTFSNDANGNRTTVERRRTTADGSVVSAVERRVYDRENRAIEEVDGVGNVVRTAYDGSGHVTTTTDGKGRRTTNAYDAVGRLTRTTYRDGTSESYSYDANGNKVAMVDRAGRTTRYEFDALDRQVRTTYPDGATSATTYDDAGRVAAQTDERGNRTTFEYDGNGQVTRSVDERGATTIYEYDGNGNKVRETDARGHVTSFAYDVNNRMIRTTHPDGTFQASTYDTIGQRLTSTDEAGLRTSFAYDPVGRLAGVTEASGSSTSYAHDEWGNLTRVTDARGNATELAYDNAGNVVGRELPLGQEERFAYDGNGNVVSHTDFNGATTTRSYDAVDRLASEQRPEQTIDYAYTATDLVASVDDDAGETRYTYDARDRLEGVTNPDGATIDYGYDAAGNRTSVTSAAGTIEYDYDVQSNMVGVTDPSGGETRYGYDLARNRTSASLPNGTRTAFEYDDRNRLTSIDHRRADNTVIAGYDYTLGPAGHRLSVAEHDGRTTRYRYDDSYRLVEEDLTDPAGPERTARYAYDAVGNRVSRTVGSDTTDYAYDANDRLLSAGATTFDYDDNGNLVRRSEGASTRTFGYDSTNHLASTSDGSSSAQFRYDAFGNRVAATRGSTTTSYLVDDDGPLPQVLEERSGDGSAAAHYVYGTDLISQRRGGDDAYYHHDATGSTRALTDSGAATSDTYDFDAFGEELGATGTTTNDFRFLGEQREPAIDGYNLRARNYDPATGRFDAIDPLLLGDRTQPLSLHKYLYAGADPINKFDRSGLSFISSATAFCILAMDFALARAGVFLLGVIYQFRAVTSVPGIVNRIYTGMTWAWQLAARASAHAPRVQAWLSQIEVRVTLRIQLRALEQVRLLAVRINHGRASVENVINAMTRHNWEAVGRELVVRWQARQLAAGVPPSMVELMDDVDLVLRQSFAQLAQHF